MRDADAVAGAARDAEVVFHLAAQPIVRAALEDPAGTFEHERGRERRMCSSAARDAVVVCVTSDKCYAPGPGPHREGDPLGGADPYSASKAAQEHVAAAYREALGVRVATARAGNVIGGGDWGRDRLLPDLVRARESGAPVTLRHPDAVRPWQHVLDPLAGYLRLAERLAESDECAQAWNFGPAGAETVRWVVDRVLRALAAGVEVGAGRRQRSRRRRCGWTRRRPASGWAGNRILRPRRRSSLPSSGTTASARGRTRGP